MRHGLVTLLLVFFLGEALFAQNYHRDLADLEERVQEKYFDASLPLFRYEGDTEIAGGEIVEGNVLVADGDLLLKGRVTGSVLVLFGKVMLEKEARVDGDVIAVSGQIRQARGSVVSGNQIETKAKNFMPDKNWARRYEEQDEEELEGDWDEDGDWEWSRRFHGAYSTLPLKEIDDDFKFSYNRVQGFFAGIRVPESIGSGNDYVDVHGFLGYGFSDYKWRYEVGLTRWLFDPRTYRFELGAKIYDRMDTQDGLMISDMENSLSAFFLHRDYVDFFRRKGFELHVSQNWTIFLRGMLAYRSDTYFSVSPSTDWALFGGKRSFGPNPAITDGLMRSVYGELYLDTRDNKELPSAGWYARLGLETSSREALSSDFSFNRYQLDVRRYQRLSRGERLDIRLMAGTSEGELPLQKLYRLGGLSTLRGYNNKTFQGDRMLLANIEYVYSPSGRHSLLFLDNVSYIAFFDAGRAWYRSADQKKWSDGFSALKWRDLQTDVGLALSFKKGKYRFSMARRLDTGKDPFVFAFRMVKPF